MRAEHLMYKNIVWQSLLRLVYELFDEHLDNNFGRVNEYVNKS